METAGLPEFGVCVAVDVHYPRTGGARAAAVLTADAAFAHVLAERIAVVPRVPPYQPGEFYLRELPPLHAVLDGLSGLGLLVVDGYADLDPGGRPGLGAHAHAAFGIPVIGRTDPHALGTSDRPPGYLCRRAERSMCERSWYSVLRINMQAEQPHIELAGPPGRPTSRPEHLVSTLGSKHIKTLGIRIGCRHHGLLTSS